MSMPGYSHFRENGGEGLSFCELSGTPATPQAGKWKFYPLAAGWHQLDDAGVESLLGGGGNTLDEAYDEGGAGVGRTITADAGAVEIARSAGTVPNTVALLLSGEETGAGNTAIPLALQNDGAVSITNEAGFRVFMNNTTPAQVAFGEDKWNAFSTTAGSENTKFQKIMFVNGNVRIVEEINLGAALWTWNLSGDPVQYNFEGDTLSHLLNIDGNTGQENIGLFGGSAHDFGGGSGGILAISEAAVIPSAATADPSGLLLTNEAGHWFGESEISFGVGTDDGRLHKTVVPTIASTIKELNGEWHHREDELATIDDTAAQVLVSVNPVTDGLYTIIADVGAYDAGGVQAGRETICVSLLVSNGGLTFAQLANSPTHSCQHGQIPTPWVVGVAVTASGIDITVTGALATNIDWRAWVTIEVMT